MIGGGFSDEEVAIWDSTGTLVAQSRQIAVPPRLPPFAEPDRISERSAVVRRTQSNDASA
ncbi:MAG: thioesterase family protein [Actinomycetota bacterium]|nr:thioesterase family protein [Actinomycetota bacterium]